MGEAEGAVEEAEAAEAEAAEAEAEAVEVAEAEGPICPGCLMGVWLLPHLSASDESPAWEVAPDDKRRRF